MEINSPPGEQWELYGTVLGIFRHYFVIKNNLQTFTRLY